MSDSSVRLDAYLVQQGYASGRDKAKALLAAGYVTVNGRPTQKPSLSVSETDRVVCVAPAERYVGRGGYKLEKALAGRRLEGERWMDVGASTGGFTDCLLQHGAAHVFSVDVGQDQLHPSLRAHPQVTVLEQTDVRGDRLRAAVSPESLDGIAMDVSFVSLTRVLPDALFYLKPAGQLICLIKPQFEAGRGDIGKRGIVKDPAAHERVIGELLHFCTELGHPPCGLTFSPVTGGEGNIEYLLFLGPGEETVSFEQVKKTVREAFRTLRV